MLKDKENSIDLDQEADVPVGNEPAHGSRAAEDNPAENAHEAAPAGRSRKPIVRIATVTALALVLSAGG